MRKFLAMALVLVLWVTVVHATLQTVQGGLIIPNVDSFGGSGTFSYLNSTAITANTMFFAGVFQVPKSGSIRKVHFRYGSAITACSAACSSGNPTRMNATIQTVSTVNGNPTGTAYGGAVAGASTALPTASAWDTITLGTNATATKGDIVAAVIGFANVNTSDSITFSIGSSSATPMNLPYYDTFTTLWTKGGNGWIFAIEYSDGSFDYIQSNPWSAITNQTFSSSTSPSEYALRFSLPFPGRVSGLVFNGGWTGINASVVYVVYGGGGTTVSTSETVNREFTRGATTVNNYIRFTTPYVFAANEVVRVSIDPSTATNVTLPIFTFNIAAIMDQVTCGQSCFLSTRAGGAWTDVTTQRPAIAVIIDQLSDGAGGGTTKKVFIVVDR